MTLYAPTPPNNNNGIILPNARVIIDENIYYLIKNSGFKIYDTEGNYYGISTGFSLRPTHKTYGAIEINLNGSCQFIRGNVKYIEDNNYILYKITVA
jgi:hypothetical protein